MSFHPDALPVGADIFGYRISRVLGAGGFGIAYEAEHAITGERVAIKEFFPKAAHAARKSASKVVYPADWAEVVTSALNDFETSTTELCRFGHPNILKVIDYIEANSTGYMITEYINGKTLEDVLRD